MRIFLSEWRKLRRPTLFLGSMGAVIAVTALIVSLLFLLIDSDTGNAERGMRITREFLRSLPESRLVLATHRDYSDWWRSVFSPPRPPRNTVTERSETS